MAGIQISALDSSLTSVSTMLAGLPGGWEWIVVLLAILLLFGRRIPGLARNLGQGISSFKKGLNESDDDDKDDDEDDRKAKKKKAAKKKAEAEEDDDEEEADAA